MALPSDARAVAFAGGLARSFAAAVWALALAPMPASADDRVPYRSETGRFSVDFPAGSPSVRALEGSKFSITDNDVRHSVFAGGAEFVVEIHDIPRIAQFLLTSHYVLERAAHGMLDDIGGSALDSIETSVRDEPAREVAFEIPERAIEGRLLSVLVGRRLYLVSVRHPQSDDPPEASAPFFESFSFWRE